MLEAAARAVVGLIGGVVQTLSENGGSQLWTDLGGALWVRDYQGQPAQQETTIVPNDGANISVGSFRAIRFDGAGTVKYDRINIGGALETGVTRNVVAGEVWSKSSACVIKIYATGTTVSLIDALG